MTFSRNSIRPALLTMALLLAACSGQPQSLADYIAALCATSFRSAPPDEAPFLAENVGAMTKMMIDMGIRPSGDVDADFVAMMIPHHQGAIDMARVVLKYGKEAETRKMAEAAIATQEKEIIEMKAWLAQKPASNASAPRSP